MTILKSIGTDKNDLRISDVLESNGCVNITGSGDQKRSPIEMCLVPFAHQSVCRGDILKGT